MSHSGYYHHLDQNIPSEMFLDSLYGGGSCAVDCQCGKEHLAEGYDGENWDDCYQFEYKDLNGLQFVLECEGCMKKLAIYEQFIWGDRDAIRRYLKTRIDQELQWAEHEKLQNTLAGIP